jgi:hypothetical protein
VKNKSQIKKQTPQGYQAGRTRLNLLNKFKNLQKKFFANPSTLLVADLQLNNGDNELHVVEVHKDSFKLFGKRYIVNSEYLTFNRTLQMHVGKYHESLSIPILQHIDVNKTKEAIVNHVGSGSAQADVISNLDPAILESLVTSTVIQKVFAGAELQDLFGLLKMLSVIILIVACLDFVLNVGMSGLF